MLRRTIRFRWFTATLLLLVGIWPTTAQEETESSQTTECHTDVPLLDEEQARFDPEMAKSDRLSFMLQQMSDCVVNTQLSSAGQGTGSSAGSGQGTGSGGGSSTGSGSGTGSGVGMQANAPSSSTGNPNTPQSLNPMPNTPMNQPGVLSRASDVLMNPNSSSPPTGLRTPQNSLNSPQNPFQNVQNQPFNTQSTNTLGQQLVNELVKQAFPVPNALNIGDRVRDGDLVLDSYAQTLFDAYEAETDPQKKAKLLEALNAYVAAENGR